MTKIKEVIFKLDDGTEQSLKVPSQKLISYSYERGLHTTLVCGLPEIIETGQDALCIFIGESYLVEHLSELCFNDMNKRI